MDAEVDELKERNRDLHWDVNRLVSRMETLEEEVRSLRAATVAPKIEHPSPVLGGPLELGSSFYQSVPLSPPQFLQRTLEFPDDELE